LKAFIFDLKTKIKTPVCKTTIFPVVLYGCETWSKNKVQRRIFEPKMHEVTRGWRKLHKEKHHNLYSSPNIMSTMKPKTSWTGHVQVTCMGKIGTAYRIFAGKSVRKTLLERSIYSRTDNIKTGLKEIGKSNKLFLRIISWIYTAAI
jgi:hypothetical protein